MNNPFRISRVGLRTLLSDSQGRFVRENYNRLLQTYTRTEIEQQLNSGAGPAIDAILEHSREFARRTSNVEVITALGLSDFYHPHDETEIVFELRRNVDPNTITTYEEMTAAFENDTHIDCQISTENATHSFQIKRYPMEHLGYTVEAFIEWFENVLASYGNMNRTTLCILILPSEANAQHPLHLPDLANSIRNLADEITFDEVALTYNDHGQNFVLHKVYPEHRRILIPLSWGLMRFRGEV